MYIKYCTIDKNCNYYVNCLNKYLFLGLYKNICYYYQYLVDK